MMTQPQILIANHCFALMQLIPGRADVAVVREFAVRDQVTEHMLVVLLANLHAVCHGHSHEGAIRTLLAALHDLSSIGAEGPEVSVRQLLDSDDKPVYRCMRGGVVYRGERGVAVLHLWMDRKGWEWARTMAFDDLRADPYHPHDLPRQRWPVGLHGAIVRGLRWAGFDHEPEAE